MGSHACPNWTEEQRERARELWTEGLSASQISRALHVEKIRTCSRNAVIGIIHRLGLNGRISPSKPRLTRQVKARATPSKVMMPPIPPKRTYIPRVVEAAVDPIRDEHGAFFTVLTINDSVCKWPIGEPQDKGFAFCGRGAEIGRYCACHARLAFQPANAPTRAR